MCLNLFNEISSLPFSFQLFKCHKNVERNRDCIYDSNNKVNRPGKEVDSHGSDTKGRSVSELKWQSNLK